MPTPKIQIFKIRIKVGRVNMKPVYSASYNAVYKIKYDQAPPAVGGQPFVRPLT